MKINKKMYKNLSYVQIFFNNKNSLQFCIIVLLFWRIVYDDNDNDDDDEYVRNCWWLIMTATVRM